MSDSAGKILIVDDEPDVLVYLTAILKQSGYQTFTANSAAGGLKQAGEIEPDLICLDIMMPHESGISLYTRLKKDAVLNRIPVLIISGAMTEKEFDIRSYVDDQSIPSPDAYLEKPIVVDRYLKVIAELISSVKKKRNGSTANG